MGRKLKEVEIEETVKKLCRATCSLRRKQEALWKFFGSEEASIDEIDDIDDAILDLCGVPEDSSDEIDWQHVGPENPPDAFVRDDFQDDLEELLSPEMEKRDFKGFYFRLRGLARKTIEEWNSEN